MGYIDPNLAEAAQGNVSGNPAYNILNGLPPNMPMDAYGNPDWDRLRLLQLHRNDDLVQTYNPVTRVGRFKKGTTSVAGKYQRGTDSVNAKLTPREAVLNRNAAELLGRDAIKRLNAHGNMLSKRGVDLASLPSDPTPGPSTENMLGYQMGTYDVGRDDRGDLMRDTENTFYGGGHPMPTPTPTSTPRMRYQYGTEDVRRRRNAASRITNYSPLTTATQGVRIGGNFLGAGSTLAPEDNPAYQAALKRNPTPASRYAAPTQAPSMVGTYRSDYGPRAVVSTGANSFRTYDPQGGYIGRTGNAADYLNKQFSANPSNPVQPTAAPTPAPAATQNVVTTPTSLSINTGQQFQPYNLESNPFTQPANLTLDQPRRYSDLY